MVEHIGELISWLDSHKNSNNLPEICRKIDELSIMAVTLGEQVGTAYGLMNIAEDEFKLAYAKHLSSLDMAYNKAEKQAEIASAPEKRLFTQSKNTYKRLSIYLERIDRVIESYRQLVSVSKLDLKHS